MEGVECRVVNGGCRIDRAECRGVIGVCSMEGVAWRKENGERRVQEGEYRQQHVLCRDRTCQT